MFFLPAKSLIVETTSTDVFIAVRDDTAVGVNSGGRAVNDGTDLYFFNDSLTAKAARAKNWAKDPLGPPERWPSALNDLAGLNRSSSCDKIWAKKGPDYGKKEIYT